MPIPPYMWLKMMAAQTVVARCQKVVSPFHMIQILPCYAMRY